LLHAGARKEGAHGGTRGFPVLNSPGWTRTNNPPVNSPTEREAVRSEPLCSMP
jgi:hypothetical protein